MERLGPAKPARAGSIPALPSNNSTSRWSGDLRGLQNRVAPIDTEAACHSETWCRFGVLESLDADLSDMQQG